MKTEDTLSLFELNSFVKSVLNNSFDKTCWIKAEISDVRMNQNGHCYLEFIERDRKNKNIIAKARGSIWATSFKLLKTYFEQETGQSFASGLKVLVEVSIEFHELYGYSLNVHNIDPSYTLGDQARNRAIILKQLEDEGVLTLNKELELPSITNRIAVISSPTAAGYEDFCNQIENNPDGFIFYKKLFPCIMQGSRTESSIINALDTINQHIDKFDVVVIIRGGGSSSDLSAFDSYLLATNCAQFPLPIITGIGHERDQTVLDIVAHSRAKTPTAVAELLIEHMQDSAIKLGEIEMAIKHTTVDFISDRKADLTNLFTRFSYLTKGRNIEHINKLNAIKEKLRSLTIGLLSEQKYKLKNHEQFIQLSSPDTILKKGYTLTLKDNKIVKSSNELLEGDIIINRFHDGDKRSEIR